MLKQWAGALVLAAMVPGVIEAQDRNQAIISAQPTNYTDYEPACEGFQGGNFRSRSGPTYLKSALENANNRDRLLGDAQRVLLEAIAQGESRSAMAWYWLGRVYLLKGDVAGADSALDRAQELAPNCQDDLRKARLPTYSALLRPASAMMQEGKEDSALILLSQAARFYPESPYAYQNLGILYFNRKQFDSAAANFEHAVRLSGERAASDTTMAQIRNQSLFNLGVVYQNIGKHQDAIRALGQFLQYNPNDTEVKRALATSYRAVGQTDSAQAIEAALLESGAGQEAGVDIFDIGVKAFQDKNYENAAKAFHQILAENPYYRDALFNLVNTYLLMQDDSATAPALRNTAADSVVAIGQRLVALEPLNASSLRLLARGYQIKKNQEKTLQYVMLIDSLPLSVEVASFTTNPRGASFQAMATGKKAQDVSGKAITARPVNLVVEFIDQAGTVVASQDVAVPALAEGAEHQIGLAPEGAGIIAWRYRRK